MANTSKYSTDTNGARCFGEHNRDNELHGIGIKVWDDCNIIIGNWHDGSHAPGRYIHIERDGDLFSVGEFYLG